MTELSLMDQSHLDQEGNLLNYTCVIVEKDTILEKL